MEEEAPNAINPFFLARTFEFFEGTSGFAAAAIHAVKLRRYFTLTERFLKARNPR
jgi:hypothetical protein